MKLLKTNLKLRFARSWLPILVLLATTGAFLFAAYQVAIRNNLAPESLMHDPAAVANVPFYIGSISTIGVILWAMAAAFCFMGAIFFRKTRKFWFFMSAAIFTTLLALDDGLEFHQTLFPVYFHISEGYVFLFYAVYIVAFLFYFFQMILNDTDFPILGAALLCLATSILADKILHLHFFEDGFKFLGIVFWLAYFYRTAINLVRERVQPA